MINGGISIRVSLKISKVFISPSVALFMKFNSFRELLGNWFIRRTIRRIKSIIIAIAASPAGKLAIPVRAGKPRIDRNLLYPLSKCFFKIFSVWIESSIVFPGIRHYFCIKKGCRKLTPIQPFCFYKVFYLATLSSHFNNTSIVTIEIKQATTNIDQVAQIGILS